MPAMIQPNLTGLHRLTNSFGGDTYRAFVSGTEVVLKYRTDRRPLAVTQSVSHLLELRGCVVQTVELPLHPVQDGWLLGLKWLEGHTLSSGLLNAYSPGRRFQLGNELAHLVETMHSFSPRSSHWVVRVESRLERKRRQALELEALTISDTKNIDECWGRVRHSLIDVKESLIHRDLHPANVLVLDDGSICAIDLENARFADPIYDLVKVRDLILRLDADFADGFRDTLGILRWNRTEWERFRAVCILEYISAVVYHARRGESLLASARRLSLLTICDMNTLEIRRSLCGDS